MTKLFGIKNCDTVKKARRWLEQHDQGYEFHDFREDGLSKSTFGQWLRQIGSERLINRRSTTWKQLSPTEQKEFEGEPISKAAIEIVLANPTLIKRPVLESESTTIVGFKEQDYQAIFN